MHQRRWTPRLGTYGSETADTPPAASRAHTPPRLSPQSVRGMTPSRGRPTSTVAQWPVRRVREIRSYISQAGQGQPDHPATFKFFIMLPCVNAVGGPVTECGLARLVDQLRLDFLLTERHPRKGAKQDKWQGRQVVHHAGRSRTAL